MSASIGLIVAIISIVLEWGYFKLKSKSEIYGFDNTISNLSIGICERLIYLLMIPLFADLFQYIYDHFRIAQIPNVWYNWVLILVCTDFVWYWYHRLGHRVNLFWAAHIVHHQSEDFNLSVAARITIFQAYIRTLFWCILPFLGFPVEMILFILVVHGAYSFFTHTQLTHRSKWLEYVFITPSLHRVHHASNQRYLDKNYGDVFSIWDRLFGTFEPETEKPVYGLTKPLESHSFLWQHLHYYVELIYFARTKKGIWRKVKVFLDPPEKMDENIREVVEQRYLKTTSVKLSDKMGSYATFQSLMMLAILLIDTFLFRYIETWLQVEIIVFVLITLINIGAILEQKRYVFELEIARIWQLVLLVSIHLQWPLLIAYFTLLLAYILIAFPIRDYFLRYILRVPVNNRF